MIEVNEQILSDVSSGFNLPAKPEVLQQLQDELSSQEPELGNVANIIAADVATAAAVLKIINSPFYGLSRSVTDVRQAVMFLGLENITSLVTGYLLKNAFDQSKCAIQLGKFWDNANDIANVACIIARALKSPLPVENLHMLGLFHDAGIPAMAMRFDDYAQLMQEHAQNDNSLLITKEDNRYHTNHAIVGYYLASSWNLPKDICQLILQHHSNQFFHSNTAEFEMSCYACLRLAENLVFESRQFRPEPQWALIEQMVLDTLKLDQDEFQDIKEDVEDYFVNCH